MDSSKVIRLWKEAIGPETALQLLSTESTFRPPSWEEPLGSETVVDRWGEALPAFSPVEEIGRGGMGQVFRAIQNRLAHLEQLILFFRSGARIPA